VLPSFRAGQRSRGPLPRRPKGTLFLVSGADNPTTLAFLPETYTILIGAGDVVGCYQEAFDRLRALYGAGTLPRTVNMISGHGLKRLHVVVLG
jgi:L-lactate dehydrogenase complex protein LldG